MHLLSNLPSSYKIRETRRPHGTTFHRQRRKTAPSREKKEAEFYQNKYNEMLWQSKFEDDEDE